MEKIKESKTKQRSIRLKEPFIKEIQDMADEQNRTFNNMVETLLYMATQQQRTAL